MTPALNSILHLPAASSAGQGAEFKDSTPPTGNQINPPAEKFQAVMERLVEIFSRANSSPKAKTGQTTLPAASPEKKDETAKDSADSANVANPPATEIKFDSTVAVPLGGILISPVVVPVFGGSNGKSEIGEQKAEISATQCGILKIGSTTPNSKSISEAIAISIPASRDIGIPTALAKVQQPNFPAVSANGETNSPVATLTIKPSAPIVTKSGLPVPPGRDLPAFAGTPSFGKSGNEKSDAKPADGTNQTQKQPATITITVQKSAGGDRKPEVGGQNSLTSDFRPPTSGPSSGSRPSVVEHAGTVVAQQDAVMKMAAKKTDFSGTLQKLPGTAASIGVKAGENLPTAQQSVVSSQQSMTVGSPADRSPLSVVPELASSPAPTAMPSIQRMQELVSLQVMRLHESGADEMHVVIKPDTGMQLSLQLIQRDGNVQVQAVLDRGNYDLLSRHWPELQQQLESRGVRVAPLASADQSFGGGSEGFRQPTTPQGQHAGDDVEPDETSAALIPGLPPATATASASRISSRQLETWA